MCKLAVHVSRRKGTVLKENHQGADHSQNGLKLGSNNCSQSCKLRKGLLKCVSMLLTELSKLEEVGLERSALVVLACVAYPSSMAMLLDSAPLLAWHDP
jgi:hypothetical protein